VGHLGVRQVQVLAVWLKTVGLVDRQGEANELNRWLRVADLDTPLPWEFLWAEAAVRWPTASWFVRELGIGSWTTMELEEKLC